MLLTLPQITHEARGERRKRLKQKYGFKFQLKTRKVHHCKSEAGMGMDSLEDSVAITRAKKEKEKKKGLLERLLEEPTQVQELLLHILKDTVGLLLHEDRVPSTA